MPQPEKNFSRSVSIITLSKFSQLASLVGPSLDEAEALDYYEGLSAKPKDIASGLCKMAATMHYLAMD